MAVLSNPLKGETFKRAGAYFEPLHVVAQDAPNMTVQISAGGYWSEGQTEYIEFAGGTSPLFTAPGVNAKWVLVTLKADGTIDLIDGVAAASPVQPIVPEDNRLVLAGVYINAGTTALTPGMINDFRPLFQVGHGSIAFSSISGIAAPNIIPITSVTNLQTELNDRYTVLTVDNLLDSKADMAGTNDLTFTLNQDEVGTPSADASLIVERGSSVNVSIRWNESGEFWEFTNDGAVFQPFQSASFPRDFDNFTGTGASTYTTTFSFSTPPVGKVSVLVYVNGILADSNLAYTATAPNQVVFNAGFIPAVGDRVEVLAL